MSQEKPAEKEVARNRPLQVPTLMVAAFVLMLAVAALVIPRVGRQPAGTLLLVVDPLGDSRGDVCYRPLTRWLSRVTAHPLRLTVVSSLAELSGQRWDEIDLVLCPDGTALGLPTGRFSPLAAGRRQAPRNLRPRSVLVYRQAAGFRQEPWFTAPERTVLGDSLSLAGFGVVCRKGIALDGGDTAERWRRLWTFGPDPYDHTPALHALRLGCFDYAVVRELAVEKFLAAGMLDPAIWGVQHLSEPLPDVVVMVAKHCPATLRVRLGEVLVGLGRRTSPIRAEEAAVLAGLNRLGLDGFNLLLEPDFSQLRGRFERCWPRALK